MIVEQRTYDINPGTPLTDFLSNYEMLGLEVQKRILKGFLGYFTNEFGTQNQVTHFWAFKDLEDRREKRAELAASPEWQECISVVRRMIVRWENKIMYPTNFSPIRSLPIAVNDTNTAFDID
ncbi:NIPSNAP family protein [Bacillus sp. REN16]|uniref:NIPSNAP family protein n=1 Tax=Bacillus sp. REN16 TaxID=2887296 RepID=UPI001E2B30F9|nr:NIPSNAP family protein [Bacillus sp. REN16]MCC3359464.1 NIPSNAP family protein [Bacillus sp. REN16]